jgi:hypothetical protein
LAIKRAKALLHRKNFSDFNGELSKLKSLPESAGTRDKTSAGNTVRSPLTARALFPSFRKIRCGERRSMGSPAAKGNVNNSTLEPFIEGEDE